MQDSGWERRCALCGAADGQDAAPVTDEDWQCARCDAVRSLWEPVTPARRETG